MIGKSDINLLYWLINDLLGSSKLEPKWMVDMSTNTVWVIYNTYQYFRWIIELLFSINYLNLFKTTHSSKDNLMIEPLEKTTVQSIIVATTKGFNGYYDIRIDYFETTFVPKFENLKMLLLKKPLKQILCKWFFVCNSSNAIHSKDVEMLKAFQVNMMTFSKEHYFSSV